MFDALQLTRRSLDPKQELSQVLNEPHHRLVEAGDDPKYLLKITVVS